MDKTIEIKIRNYEKYKGRSDVKHNSWFRCSNRILEDYDFFDFTHEERLVWIYILSVASQKNTANLCISYRHADRLCGLTYAGIVSALEKLSKIKAIEFVQKRSERGRYATDTHKGATDRQTDKQDRQTDTRASAFKENVPSLTLGTGTKSAVSFYCEQFKSKYKSNPDITGKESGILKTLVKDLGQPRVLKLLEAYFSMPDALVAQRRHDLGTFRLKLTEVGHYADTGAFITRTKIKEIDEEIHYRAKNAPTAEQEARLSKIFEDPTKTLDGAS